MITIFFNDQGYYITGEGNEIIRRCYPALTENGEPIFQSLHHCYKVLYLALKELHGLSIKEDIMVYNDSRIIDEINGIVRALDSVCEEWLQIIKRHSIPAIKTVVFFRKKAPDFIKENIILNNSISIEQKQELVNKEKRISENLKATRLKRFKESWYEKKFG